MSLTYISPMVTEDEKVVELFQEDVEGEARK